MGIIETIIKKLVKNKSSQFHIYQVNDETLDDGCHVFTYNVYKRYLFKNRIMFAISDKSAEYCIEQCRQYIREVCSEA